MHGNVTIDYDVWFELFRVLSLGTLVIVGVAAVAERLVEDATWRRTGWRIATMAMWILVLAELGGVGLGLRWLIGAGTEPSGGRRGHKQDVASAAKATTEASTLAPTSVGPNRPRGAADDDDHGPYGRRVDADWQDVVMGPPEAGRSGPGVEDMADWLAFQGTDRFSIVDRQRVVIRATSPEEEQEALAWPGHRPVVRVTEENEATAKHAKVSPPAHPPLRWPGLLWLAGAVTIAGKIVWARIVLFLARRRQTVVRDRRVRRRFRVLAAKTGVVVRRVRLVESEALTTPVAFGILRPTIALPVTFSDDFRGPQQEAILAHELCHLAARDPMWQLVSELTLVWLWWHPLVWWSRNRMRAASESAADEASLLVPEGPEALASSLVALGWQLARAQPSRVGWLSVTGPDFRSGLGRRVQRLLNLPGAAPRPPARSLRVAVTLIAPLLLEMLIVFGTAWVQPRVALAEGETTMNVFENSWRRSVAAAAFVPLLSLLSGDALSQDTVDDQLARAVADDTSPPVRLAQRNDDRREEMEERERAELKERERAELKERERDLLNEADRERDEAKRRAREEIEELEALERIEQLRARNRAETEAQEQRKRADFERQASRRDRDRAEDEARERPEVARHLAALKREFLEAVDHATNMARELQNDPDGERGRQLRRQYDETRRRMEEIVQDVVRYRDQRQGREESVLRQTSRVLARKREELLEKAQSFKRQMDRLRDDQDDEARELQAALRGVEQELRQLEEEARLMGRRAQQEGQASLQQLQEAYQQLRNLGRNEEARRMMSALAERRRGGERLREPGPRPGAVPPEVREELERLRDTVGQLRGQMEAMQDQMNAMRELLENVAGRNRDEVDAEREPEVEDEHAEDRDEDNVHHEEDEFSSYEFSP